MANKSQNNSHRIMASSNTWDASGIIFVNDGAAALSTRRSQKAARAHTAHVNWQHYRERRLRLNKQAAKASKTEASSVMRNKIDKPANLASNFTRDLQLKNNLIQDSSPSTSHSFSTLIHGVPVGQQQIAAQVANHCTRVIWPEMLYCDRISSAWFQSFCENPVIFHGFHLAASVHADVLDRQVTLSVKPEMLKHKIATIGLLNSMLSEPKTLDINIAIKAILLLTHSELEGAGVMNSPSLLFSAHFPIAGWPGVYANIADVEQHTRALHLLVQRAGGLKALSFPGLGSVLGFCDLLASSAHNCRPTYSCFWDEMPPWPISTGVMRPSRNIGPGRGFHMHPTHPLPSETLSTLNELANVDAAMTEGRHRRMRESDYCALIYARNAIQHRLLSLPVALSSPYSSHEASQTSTLAEVCRLTALLYSNTVILPLPPHRPWRGQLLDSLRILLHDTDLRSDGDGTLQIYVWSASVAALVAFGSEFEGVFGAILCQVLELRNMRSSAAFNALRALLSEFLWSPPACDAGLVILWNKLIDDELLPLGS